MRYSICVIETDPEMHEALVDACKRASVVPHSFTNHAEALVALGKGLLAQKVVCNVGRAGEGPAFLRELRLIEGCTGLPVCFYSGHTETSFHRAMGSTSVDKDTGFTSKDDVSPDELIAMLFTSPDHAKSMTCEKFAALAEQIEQEE